MPWTDEQRAEALRLLAEVGPAEAARQTGIPKGTIASWGSRLGVTAVDATTATRAAVEHRVATIAERKAALAEGLMDDIDRLRRDLFAPTVERKVMSVRTGEHLTEAAIVDVHHRTTSAMERKTTMQAIALAVDKVQLLTGEATERVEQLGGDAVKERALATVHQLAAKRQAS